MIIWMRKACIRPCAAGVFPFRLGRQAIDASRLTLLGHFRQTATDLDGVLPGDGIDRVISRCRLARETRRVVSHDPFVLMLRHRMHAKEKRLTYCDDVPRALIGESLG